MQHDPYGNRHRMPQKMTGKLSVERDSHKTPKPLIQSSVYNSYCGPAKVPKSVDRRRKLPPLENVRQSMPDPDLKSCFQGIALPEEKIVPAKKSYLKKPRVPLTAE